MDNVNPVYTYREVQIACNTCYLNFCNQTTSDKSEELSNERKITPNRGRDRQTIIEVGIDISIVFVVFMLMSHTKR